MKAILLLIFAHFIICSRSFECGIPRIKINEVIVRGHSVAPGSFPWHVAIYHQSRRSDSYACGGTLISPNFVLTAYHCVKDDNGYVLSSKRIFVRLGVHNVKRPNLQTSQHHDVLKIHKFVGSQQRRNDIALLELSTEAMFNDHVQPACINQKEDITGQYGVAVGWGFTEDDEVSSTLQAARMPIVSTATCLEHDRDTFGQTLDSSVFCAGFTNGTTVCNGDSGGGLHVKRGNKWFLVGIISFTAARDVNSFVCRTDSYAAFTNVAIFSPWIHSITDIDRPVDKENTGLRGDNEEIIPSNKFNLYKNCGKYLRSRIIGGLPAKLFEFPWVAYLLYQYDEYQCGGSLISDDYVLTSAKCVFKWQPVQVRLGEHDLNRVIDCNQNDPRDCAPPVQDIDVEFVIIHPNYDYNQKRNDIALIKLSERVQFEDHIQPICLPSQSVRYKEPREYFATGFGITDINDPKTSDILMKVIVPAVSRTDCQNIFPDIHIGTSKLCAGGDGRDTCVGDAGGPLGSLAQMNGALRFIQYGITSFGKICGKFPAVYTNVAYYVDWIMVNIKKDIE